MKNQVQLITYVDRLGGTLPGLRELLTGKLRDLFGAVHLLPFFKHIDGADAGFDPIDHASVDSRLGDWNDLRSLAGECDVMADIIVNHISSRSAQFQDLLQRGGASPYDGMFLTYGQVFPMGATERDLLTLHRTRADWPFTPVALNDGTCRLFWTSFTPEQIDIDVHHPRAAEYLDNILRTFSANGVRIIRLDAAGYAIKRSGTSCFMISETFDFIAGLSARARDLGLEVLVEVHSHFRHQIDIARHVDWVYDFALPPLLLHALFNKTTRYLREWLGVRPQNCLTVLDTHDGIGITDIAEEHQGGGGAPGLVPAEELVTLVERIHRNSRGESASATGPAASNLDFSQVNCTFFDALGRSDTHYLIARAIQLFVPGIPQIYYVGLLAGENDMQLLQRTKVGRDINRHYYTPAEIDTALAKPVVRKLIELVRLRNTHPAFMGRCLVGDTADHILELKWINGEDFAELSVDLASARYRIECSPWKELAVLKLDTAES